MLLRVIQLVTDLDAFLVSYSHQPLDCHSYAFLGFKLIFHHAFRVTFGGHVLYQSPEVHRIRIVTHDFFT